MDENLPVKFCYAGNTYVNNTSYQGRLKETTELGAEYIGDGSVDADGEIIALVVECFLAAGLSEFQISVGHVEFFKSLCEAASLSPELIEEIRECISMKNYFGAQGILEDAGTDPRFLELFSLLPVFGESLDALKAAKEKVSDIPGCVRAVERLEKLYEILSFYGYAQYISFDLSFLSRYDYYTGIVFDGYTYGSGEAIAKGGRYDELLSHFGKNAPAVGAMIRLDSMLTLLERGDLLPEIPKDDVLIVYAAEKRKDAINEAVKLRQAGRSVQIMQKTFGEDPEVYEAYAKRLGIGEWKIL